MESKNTDAKGRRKVLGKGLGALIPQTSPITEERAYRVLPIESIQLPSEQPRTHFDKEALEALSASIRESGVLQPLVIRDIHGRYELIAGERRLRASKLAGLREVPCVIKDVNDNEAFTLALIENIQRQDLNPIEEARAYRRLTEDFGYTQEQIANNVGMSRTAVANSLRLLQLPEKVRQHVASGEFTAGHARALVTLSEEDAHRAFELVQENNYSVRDTEKLVRDIKSGLRSFDEPSHEDALHSSHNSDTREGSKYRDDAQIRLLTQQLQRELGVKVRIKDSKGKGRIEIYYDDYDVFQSVFERILDEQ